MGNYKRVYNFAAGPATLPEEVLKIAASEMLDYKNSGMSVMEMSHRSKMFQDIIEEAEKDFRELLQILIKYCFYKVVEVHNFLLYLYIY